MQYATLIPDFRIVLPTMVKSRECCPTPIVVGLTCIEGAFQLTALVGVYKALSHVHLAMLGDDLPLVM